MHFDTTKNLSGGQDSCFGQALCYSGMRLHLSMVNIDSRREAFSFIEHAVLATGCVFKKIQLFRLYFKTISEWFVDVLRFVLPNVMLIL